MRAKLKISRGSNKGKSFDISGAQFVIGRAAGCNLRPQSDAISRQHCAVFNRGDRITIKDLGSRNGTTLNGDKIKQEMELMTGDELTVGPLHFRVVVMNDEGVVQEPPGPNIEDHEVSDKLPSDSGVISDWLLQEDEEARKTSSAETRQFQIDESDLIKLDDDEDQEEDEKPSKAAKGKKKKIEPGKLPSQKSDTANSRDAAAETLKRMLNRGE